MVDSYIASSSLLELFSFAARLSFLLGRSGPFWFGSYLVRWVSGEPVWHYPWALAPWLINVFLLFLQRRHYIGTHLDKEFIC
jgi:hypothetical protein